MPVQRKVFRIEENARVSAREPVPAGPAEDDPRHDAYLSELRALRALIEPRGPIDRDTMERARAQVAEAQAYRRELDMIYAAVKRTSDAMGAGDADTFAGGHTARASRELHAIVADTEQATQAILQAAEDVEQTADMLSAALKSGPEQGLARDIQDRVMQIFQACNFQDLTGQRVTNVMATLRFVEDHVVRLLEIWQRIEHFVPIVLDEADAGERRLLHGPKLAGEAGHCTQEEIDALFGCA